jgi:hypothetical protein
MKILSVQNRANEEKWMKKHITFILCNVSGPNTFNENETIAKYEIMDGAPVRGE